jgi:hypothetical protein
MDNVSRNKACETAVSPKRPYKAPSFRFEIAFEVAALACGKTANVGGSCRVSRKAS